LDLFALQISRITLRGQATIPKRIRESANLRAGDSVAFDFENDCILMRKVAPADDGYLGGLAGARGE
jgi:AbrB family looped-hinge helix DNA binding protein